MIEQFEKNNRNEWPSWKALLRISACVFALFLITRYWGAFEQAIRMLLIALTAVFFGFCIAYVVNIPLRVIERNIPHKEGRPPNRNLTLALALILSLGLFALILLLVIPQFLQCMLTFAQNIPSILESLKGNEGLVALMPNDVYNFLVDFNWDEVSENVFAWFQSGIASALPQVLSVVGVIGTFGIGCVFSIWLLADKEKLAALGHRLVRTYLGQGADDRLVRAATLLDDSFQRYIIGQTLEASILGALVAVGATLFGLPYSVMIGALIALMAFIPMVGALIGAIIGALMIFTVSWQQAIVFLVLFIVIQQIEANFIYARVVGKIVGLGGFWTLLGITVGGSLFGIVGAFVGVPITAAIYRAVGNDMDVREASGDTIHAQVQRALEE